MKSSDRRSHAGPLAGIRVVDMTTSYAGPTAAMYLGDLGADVVKVERPGGDDARGWGPPFVSGDSAWFAAANRNKRSIVIDLKSASGAEVLDHLLDSADVFLENLNPSKLERLGVHPERVMHRNTRLVYCSFSGFGITGPDAALPGYDLIAQAATGMMSVTGAKGGRPQRVSTALADITTAICAVAGISAALVRRASTGSGELVDVSLADSSLALMAPRIAAYHAGEPEPAPSGGTDSVLAVYQSFAAADRDIVVAVGNDSMWERFCMSVGLECLLVEAHDKNSGRRKNREQLTEAIASKIRERNAAEWLEVLARSEIPASLVNRLSEVVSHEHFSARESIMAVPGSDGGLVSVASPFRFGSMPSVRNERFPSVGQHTESIMRELGYADDTIADFLDRGIVSSTPALAAELKG